MTEAPTLARTICAINDLWLLRSDLSRLEAMKFEACLVEQQGLPGSYAGVLFAPVDQELAEGYRMPTGEVVRTRAGAVHVMGEEALRALILLNPETWLGKMTIHQASAGMERRLVSSETGLRQQKGFYCCHNCTVALWRALAVNAYARAEERLAAGMVLLRARRDNRGRWEGYPFYYTISALIGIDLKAAREEIRYAAESLEASLRRLKDTDEYAVRRRAVIELALAQVS
jgi:hypothetical protein